MKYFLSLVLNNEYVTIVLNSLAKAFVPLVGVGIIRNKSQVFSASQMNSKKDFFFLSPITYLKGISGALLYLRQLTLIRKGSEGSCGGSHWYRACLEHCIN
jgi:hypothetical protein